MIIMAEAKETKKQVTEDKEKTASPWEVLSYPHLTEKSMNMVEMENKLVFIVSINHNKEKIKEAIEKQFNVRVEDIKTTVTTKGKKKAIATLGPDFQASDIASKLGMM